MIESMRFDAAVEVGIAAFCAGEEPPGDEEVWERLTGAGVEPWLAERLLLFLPMAYTRRLLPDVSYPDGLVTPGGRVSLSAEPVFVAASGRAQRADRGEVERIAVRSSEFRAINHALHTGSELSDLMLGEPMLVEDLEPVEQGDGGVPSPRAVFEAFLREHGVSLDGETKIGAQLFVHPAPAGVVLVQVDFTVSHPALARPWLVESFVGDGTTWRDAIGEAVGKFRLGALHPIVDGLLRPGAAPDQVERERYDHPGGAFELVLGPQINLFTDRSVPYAGPLLDRLLEALRAEPLTRKVHGLRVFIAYHDGRLQINEVLLDNEQWPGGEAVVADSRAPLPDGRVAVRIFGLLVPVGDA
ncbi:hypothetical protein FHS43_004421 [Streptosporangium becharense]|uniref:Uncharacterized protein n=1 Tax=Streptosporangium becharense TaxID=1816182 RepID=A0A7W9IK58_9ACTN|nr:DUF6348 family protein [Streptosporangium becharense]MBB2913123.1 hypothetical protein [Streptosporangium becharense]MBB5822106.1 hypothetical protein [Streptosporangium becharense]